MSLKSTPVISDMDKTREMLLAELQELKARNAALELCEARAERLEADLRNNEEMTRHFLEQKLYGVWINVGNKVAYINEVGARILGTSNTGEVVGKSLFEIIHPDYHDIVRDRIEAMGHGDSAVPMIEEKYVRMDGRAADLDVWAMRFIYKGEPAILVAFKDITERKRAEMALRESEAKYRDLVKNANSIIIRWDLKGNLTFFNEFAEEYFGYPASEVLGKNVIGTIVPEAESTGRDLLEMIRDIERHPERYKTNINENIRRDGERVWISWTNKAILDTNGNVVEILSVGNDITERKRAEDALSKNLAMLAKSQEIGRLASWSFDSDSEKFEVSDEMYCLYGFAPGAVEPTKDLLFKMIHPDDLERYREYFDSLLDGRLGGIDYRVVWPDGSVHYLHAIADSNVRGPDGRVKMMSGITQDITERKRAEEELKEAKAQSELYLDLMGHDINNMHQIALGYLEMARDMHPPEACAMESLDKPIEVLQRSAQLIKNVRKLQKLKEGVFQSQEVDVCEMLMDVQRELGAVPHKAINLNFNQCDRCHVRANELLHDVFANLVNNAIKHTGDRADIVISLDVVKDNVGRYCQVIVEDNGPGIPEDAKEKIFNRMQKGSARGMGLGLYLVKSLVESYGGNVRVEDRVKSDYTKGARFVVMLPAIEQ